MCVCQRWLLESTGLLPNITKSRNFLSGSDKRDDIGMAYLERRSGIRIAAGRADRLCGTANLLSNGHGGFFPGVKRRPGHDVAHSHPYAVGSENKQSCTSKPTLRFTSWIGTTLLFFDTVTLIRYRY